MQYSFEIHASYNYPNIIETLKSCRLRWTGHLVRMREDRLEFRVTMSRPGRKKPARRPSRRWTHYVSPNVSGLGWRLVRWWDLVTAIVGSRPRKSNCVSKFLSKHFSYFHSNVLRWLVLSNRPFILFKIDWFIYIHSFFIFLYFYFV